MRLVATVGQISHVSSAPPPRRVSWLSSAIVFGPLALGGEFLLGVTHHRPLGAVVFATLSVLLWVFTEVLVRRGLSEDVTLEALSLEMSGKETPGARSVARLLVGSVGILFSASVLVRAFL